MKTLISAIGVLLIVSATSASATLISDTDGNLWNYDVSTNQKQLIGNSGVPMYDIALNPVTKKLYGVGYGSALYTIDLNDGSSTRIGNTSSFINGLTFSSNGILYGSGENSLFTLDLTTGKASRVGSGQYQSAGDIAFDDMGNLYLSSISNNSSLWLLDTTTGDGTIIGETGVTNIYGLNYSDGTLYGFSDGGFTFELDTLNGKTVRISTNQISTYGATDSIPVPEPVTMSLMGFGLATLALTRRMKIFKE